MLHKLRSGLSILGVVFGVAAVVAMSSVGEGARRETLAQIEALGIDTVTVRSRPTDESEAALGLRSQDADSVRRVVPGVRAVAPVRLAELEADAGSRSAGVTVVGATPSYREATRLDLARGRFLADLDVSDRKRVAVLGQAVAARLFPSRAPSVSRCGSAATGFRSSGSSRDVPLPGAGGRSSAPGTSTAV